MDSIKRVAVFGAGTMGHGIAQVVAQGGKSVVLIDPFVKSIENAREKIQENIDLLIANDLLKTGTREGILSRIEFSAQAERAKDADIVMEAVPERWELKKELFEKLSAICLPDCILASNSSGIPITKIASVTSHPERVLGTHFFNPAHLIPVVEIIQTEKTDEKYVEKAVEFMREIGKTPARVRKDIPGYVANRLQHALAREAMSLVQKGIISGEELDAIVTEGFALRMIFNGPILQRDLNGLDTHIFVNEYLYKNLENTEEPLAIIKTKVAAGELGVKTGKGFYDWSGRKAIDVFNENNKKLVDLLKFIKNRK